MLVDIWYSQSGPISPDRQPTCPCPGLVRPSLPQGQYLLFLEKQIFGQTKTDIFFKHKLIGEQQEQHGVVLCEAGTHGRGHSLPEEAHALWWGDYKGVVRRLPAGVLGVGVSGGGIKQFAWFNLPLYKTLFRILGQFESQGLKYNFFLFLANFGHFRCTKWPKPKRNKYYFLFKSFLTHLWWNGKFSGQNSMCDEIKKNSKWKRSPTFFNFMALYRNPRSRVILFSLGFDMRP